MTKENNKNRPTLRDVESRASVETPGGIARPALKSSPAKTPTNGGDTRTSSSPERPALAGSDANRKAAIAAPENGKSNARSTKIEQDAFDDIHAFLSSLGDPSVSVDADGPTEVGTQVVNSETAAIATSAQSGQDGQTAPSEDERIALDVQTAGTERERLGLEMNLASIQLENTDYRRLGHRDLDDKPLATTIKGGISL